MSLYFNWSCDFQRFTKSKKLSKFQVRTTTSFNLNKVLSTSLFNLQGAIYWKQDFSELFEVLNFSFAACLLYQNYFRLSRTFSKLFSKFLKQFSQNSNFSDRCLFRNGLFSISNSKPFVKNFFHSFQIFSVRPPCLSATALIEYHRDSPPVNNFFHFSAIYCNYAKRPRYRSLSIIALTDDTSVQWLQWPARRYNRRPDEIRYSPRPSWYRYSA